MQNNKQKSFPSDSFSFRALLGIAIFFLGLVVAFFTISGVVKRLAMPLGMNPTVLLFLSIVLAAGGIFIVVMGFIDASSLLYNKITEIKIEKKQYSSLDYQKAKAILQQFRDAYYNMPEFKIYFLETAEDRDMNIADTPSDGEAEIDLITAMVTERDEVNSSFGFIMKESYCEYGILSGHLPEEPNNLYQTDDYRLALSIFFSKLDKYDKRVKLR